MLNSIRNVKFIKMQTLKENVYHRCLCSIFDQTTMDQDQK